MVQQRVFSPHLSIRVYVGGVCTRVAVSFLFLQPGCGFALGPAADVWLSWRQQTLAPDLSGIHLIPSLTFLPHTPPP